MDTFQWYLNDSHKNLYENEIDILKRGLNGSFNLVKLYDPNQTNGNLTALGNLKYGNNQIQSIMIVFPSKYPYAPPKIFTGNLNEKMLDNINQAFMPIHLGKGNQYNDKAICLFRNEVWDKDHHNIGWILSRTQKWLESAFSKKGFKPEEIVEELPAPFQHIGQVLIPKEIPLDKDAKTGTLILTQFKQNYYILEQNFIQNNPFRLTLGNEVFKWYKFDKGIKLRDLFPPNDQQFFVSYMLNKFGENILTGNPQKNIGFYFPSDENKWHFFKIMTQSMGIHSNLVLNYYLSRNISEELYLRTKDIFDDKILQKKRVTIIGLGAIGSEVAKSLAKNGVGHFNLFDLDTFEIGNLIRHAADLMYVGEDKVSVVEQLIKKCNPNITVNPYKVDILRDNGLLEKSLNESDLCIVLTAEDSVDYLLNDHFIKNFNFPFIFARASSGAFSGSIQVVDSESACLRCLSLDKSDALPIPNTNVKLLELAPEYGSCSTPALPGSEIDTKEISLQVARISMQCLLQNEESVYPKLMNKQFYWHGPFGSKNEDPFKWEMKNIEKHNDCVICK